MQNATGFTCPFLGDWTWTNSWFGDDTV